MLFIIGILIPKKMVYIKMGPRWQVDFWPRNWASGINKCPRYCSFSCPWHIHYEAGVRAAGFIHGDFLKKGRKEFISAALTHCGLVECLLEDIWGPFQYKNVTQCHHKETFSTLLAPWKENWPVGSSKKGPIMHSFDAYFDIHMNKLMNKQWSCQWF